MGVRIQVRHGTAAEWATANPVLADGEAGFVKDTNTIKFGDGVTVWTDLPSFTVNKAKDADKLDGLDSTEFLRVNAQATDSAKLDGFDSDAAAATANTVVVRTANGQAVVADPTAAVHAATKAYVDALPKPQHIEAKIIPAYFGNANAGGASVTWTTAFASAPVVNAGFGSDTKSGDSMGWVSSSSTTGASFNRQGWYSTNYNYPNLQILATELT